MGQALISLFASLLIFLILTEIITIDIYYGEYIILEINFMIFAIKFIKSPKTAKKSKPKKKRFGFSKLTILSYLIFSFIKRSYLEIKYLNISVPERTPALNAINHGLYTSLLSTMIIFAEENAKFFAHDNIIITYSEHNYLKTALNAKIKISLLDILICIFASAIEAISKKATEKRGKNNYGRKQNE